MSSNCSQLCDKCPNKECFNDGNCTNQEADCEGKTTKGIDCQTQCSENATENCVECERNGKCSKCKDDKYFGNLCESPCENCPGGECNTEGKCKNTTGNCKDELYYGQYCNETCVSINEYCEKCNREGICLYCKDNLKYGENCSEPCDKCPGEICEIEEGNCINEGEYKENKYYGDNYQKECNNISSFCLTCFRNATCIKCSDNLHFGDNCTETCDRCPGLECYMNGTCIDSSSNCLNDETYGAKCDLNCTDIGNCLKCNRNETCTVCVNQTLYGDKCELSCSNCPNNTCNIDGSCIDTTSDCQNNSFYGIYCNESCTNINNNCENCSRNKICHSCINKTFWGDRCENECINCPDGECYIDGICIVQINNCTYPNKTGEKCDKNCTDINYNCLFCNRQEQCYEYINKSKYEEECNISCDKCPGIGTCDINGICDDNFTDCNNDSFTGDNCSVLCSDINPNCKTCHRNGSCSSCINQNNFWWKL